MGVVDIYPFSGTLYFFILGFFFLFFVTAFSLIVLTVILALRGILLLVCRLRHNTRIILCRFHLTDVLLGNRQIGIVGQYI